MPDTPARSAFKDLEDELGQTPEISIMDVEQTVLETGKKQGDITAKVGPGEPVTFPAPASGLTAHCPLC